MNEKELKANDVETRVEATQAGTGFLICPPIFS